jgi:hypothetical protein
MKMKKSSTVATVIRWSAGVAPVIALVSVLGAGVKWF